jgi:methyl-accepting chemotaxis protein
MRFTIKLKLGLTFTAIIASSAITALLSINSLSSLNSSMQAMVAGPMERIQTAEEMFNGLLLVVRAEKNLILANTPDQIEKFDKEIQQQRLNVVAKLDHGESIASA